MGKQYRIRAGEVFVLDNGARKTGGDVIELDADVASMHATRIELVATPVQPAPAIAKPVINVP